jgi:hypothetical protein
LPVCLPVFPWAFSAGSVGRGNQPGNMKDFTNESGKSGGFNMQKYAY